MHQEVVIVSAVRTPIGSFMGSLSKVAATDLGSIAIKAAMEKISLGPDRIQEVYMGQVVQAGSGQAPARQAALGAGISNSVPSTTINKVCASGLKAVMQAAQGILLGDYDISIAGGMENMSQIPHYVRLRFGHKFGAQSLEDGMQKDGLTDAYDKQAMGVSADLCAATHQISRADQDTYAIESYRRAASAWNQNLFANEVVPVSIKQRRGEPLIIDQDEEYRNIKPDKIPNLRAAFTADGTVTAANASTINDGAAALVLMSAQKAAQLQIRPLAKIRSYADAAQEPKWFTTAPAKALPLALKKANLSIEDVDYFELNEAFSVVGLANAKLLGVDTSIINCNGGAVALGHPLGCSGARILVTLVHLLHQKKGKIGAAAICNGGGGASAMVIERI